MQSPKSKRSHAPGESPASDSHTESTVGSQSGGTQPKQSGDKTVKSRAHSGGSGNDKGGPMYHPREVGSAYHAPAGSPGYKSSDEAQRKGGTSHQFSKGSE